MNDPASELRELTWSLRARVEEGDLFVAAGQSQGSPAGSRAVLGGHGAGGASPAGPAEVRLASLREEVSACRRCPLGAQRLTAVFGVGSPTAQVMFVGEGPGYQEDRQGEPFVGKAGQLLDNILAAIGLSRQSVYIANIVKCHPMVNPSDPDARGNDRPPTPEEVDACRPYLEEQIRLIQPRFIVTLGNSATRALVREEVAISRVRGQWRELAVPGMDRPVRMMATYHPAALLRDPNLKRDVWTDMKTLKQELTLA